jgi:protease I
LTGVAAVERRLHEGSCEELSMTQLSDISIAVVATDGVEEYELTKPVAALRNAGASVDIIGLERGKIQAFQHHDKTIKIEADLSIDEAQANQYDGLLLPGGAFNADTLRADERVLDFVREFAEAGKPMAVICHAPWILISAGVANGRKLTGYHTIKDDLINAGCDWVDLEVVVDSNLVTSRKPADIPAFNREMIRVLSQVPQRQAA